MDRFDRSHEYVCDHLGIKIDEFLRRIELYAQCGNHKSRIILMFIFESSANLYKKYVNIT